MMPVTAAQTTPEPPPSNQPSSASSATAPCVALARQLLPALLYLLRPCSRPASLESYVHVVVGNCSMRYSSSYVRVVVCELWDLCCE